MHVEAQRLLARRRMLLAMRLGQHDGVRDGADEPATERGPSSAAPAADDGRRPLVG